MQLTYNNLDEPTSILTFSDVPNILKVSEDTTGTNCIINLFFEGNLRQSVTADSQYYITIMGETVSNVMAPDMGRNKRFYISGDEDSTAMNVAMALRNCSNIAANYDVMVQGPDIYIKAKTFGRKGLNSSSLLTNIPSDNLSMNFTDGESYSILFNSKIMVDVYSGTSISLDNYVTTLEKYFYGNECAFNMSPMLATLSEFGKTVPYVLDVNMIAETGEWQQIGLESGLTTVGYKCNGSQNFKYAQGCDFLLNAKYGNKKQILYTYDSLIPFSVLLGDDRSGFNVAVSVKDSAFNEIYAYTSIGRRDSESVIKDTNASIPQEYFTSAYYVDVQIDTNEPIRFNVIKPLKATEYFQRVYWRNEYGGISFFDFTGSKSETNSINITTYEKNVFDYYTTYAYEKKKIYQNNNEKSVKLTSHLMEENGKYIFDSLAKSKRVWTDVAGSTYYIIPTNIEVNEDQNYNGIFTCTLTYKYSAE